jgi:hypothetical protein
MAEAIAHFGLAVLGVVFLFGVAMAIGRGIKNNDDKFPDGMA